MANGRRRGVGDSRGGGSTLDVIERILGISRQLGTTARNKRRERQDFDTKMINVIGGGFETEYNNDVLDQQIIKLDEYVRNSGDKFSLETKQLYDSYKSRMDSHRKAIDFELDKTSKWADDVFEWGQKSDTEKEKLYGKLDSSEVMYNDNYDVIKKKKL